VNAIYLYDDKIVLTYNFKSDSRTISLSDIECSDLPQTAPPQFAPKTLQSQGFRSKCELPRFFFVGEAFAFVFPLE
jgi:hypothetical protein